MKNSRITPLNSRHSTDIGIEGTLKFMTANRMMIPRFTKNEIVQFAGGIGMIKNYRPAANTWTYAVEMEMGPEPDFGRIGGETTVLLDEAELQAV